MKRRNTKDLKDSSSIINAAALQDHLMRSMALHTLPRTTNPFVRVRSQQQQQQDTRARATAVFRKELTAVTTTPSPYTVPAKTAPRSADLGYRRVWICETCTFENEERGHSSKSPSNQDERCHACGFMRQMKTQRCRATLAQQRGLVQAPPPKLSRDEWETCESQAIERGDAHHPCSICREPFGVQEQVLLSCSHIFHLSCIQSFERFLRTKQRVCPLCRKENYQKRMTSKAAGIHREKCAVLIQALCRGRLARKRVQVLWHDFYRRGKGDPIRRRRFLANRVGKTTDRLVSAMRARDDSIDSLLAEFDKTLSLSRQMFDEPQSEVDDPSQTMQCRGPNWPAIFMRAHARDDRECSICINSFSASMADVSLLSCSHTFHHECLRAFEDFNIYEVALCPVCRASYQARHWSEVARDSR